MVNMWESVKDFPSSILQNIYNFTYIYSDDWTNNGGHDKWTYTTTRFLHFIGIGTTLNLSKLKS